MTQLSKIGNTEEHKYYQARSSVLISKLDDINPLNQTLRYCILLTGIKKENFPSEAQKAVIIDFVTSHLKRFTLDDFKLAFSLCVSRKLDIDPTNYQSFDCIYIGKVMESYDTYCHKMGYKKRYVESKKQLPEKTDSEKKEIIIKFVQECIIDKYIESLLDGRNLIKDDFGVIYRYLFNWGFIQPTNKEKYNYFITAKKTIYPKSENLREVKEYMAFKNDDRLFKDLDQQARDNYYFRECVLRSKSLIVEAFINECLFEERDLGSELTEKLNNL